MILGIFVTHKYFDDGSTELYAPIIKRQFSLIADALKPHNITLAPVFWEDDTDVSAYDTFCPLMAWSYPQDQDKFMNILDKITASGKIIINPMWVLRDNINKSYLARLFAAGAPVPPTIHIDIAEKDKIINAFDEFGADEIIIKPIIGAGAWRQARMKRGDAIPNDDDLPPNEALIQPFLPNVARVGELSMLFFGNEFSHALMKTPKAGDYRSQTKYGAIEVNINPPQEALDAAKQILKIYDKNNDLGYGRVDMVLDENNQWQLMELELIEPYLYLPFDGYDGALGAKNFADAIAKKLL